MGSGRRKNGSTPASRSSLTGEVTYTATRADLEAVAQELFDVVRSGAVKVAVNHTYPLRDAVQVHRDLEGRNITGSVVMLPY